jgi:hypothetical protein
MLVEMYIIFQILVIVLFFVSFFTKQELLWVVTLVFSGVMMYTSYNVEYYIYEFNSTVGAYNAVVISHSYPYLMGLNLVFLSLSLILGLFDTFDKYGHMFSKK